MIARDPTAIGDLKCHACGGQIRWGFRSIKSNGSLVTVHDLQEDCIRHLRRDHERLAVSQRQLVRLLKRLGLLPSEDAKDLIRKVQKGINE